MRQHRNEQLYVVQWYMFRGGKRINYSTSYDPNLSMLMRMQSTSTKPVRVGKSQWVPVYEEHWQPIAPQALHDVARRGGTIASFRVLH